jgi:hypothetical protein
VIRRFAALLVATMVVAAACTSSSDDTTTTTESAAADGATEPVATADASGTTTAPAETVTTTTKATTTTRATTTTTTKATTTTTTVAVPAGNRAPEVVITSPGNLAAFIAEYRASSGKFGSPVTLTATATDADGDPVTIEWYSSMEGYLGSGTSISVTLHTIDSDSSQPIITARAIDQWGVSSDSSIQVIVWIPSPT